MRRTPFLGFPHTLFLTVVENLPLYQQTLIFSGGIIHVYQHHENDTPRNTLCFGIHYTDHMFIMDYSDEKGWYDPRIVPFQNISLSPAACVFHYGAEVFEGLKAYRRPDGEVQLFRPWDNMERT